jgi:ribosomal protein S18 acetylase RimI-like enzyme
MPAAKRRSRGVVRRLLEHMLGRADADGVGVWLEVTDPRNVPLYERFGFTTAHTPPSGDDAARGG